jgi:hypothetical protein
VSVLDVRIAELSDSRRTRKEACMRSAAIALIFSFAAASCSPDPEVISSTNKCATDLYPTYNPNARNQCLDVCIVQSRHEGDLLNIVYSWQPWNNNAVVGVLFDVNFLMIGRD